MVVTWYYALMLHDNNNDTQGLYIGLANMPMWVWFGVVVGVLMILNYFGVW